MEACRGEDAEGWGPTEAACCRAGTAQKRGTPPCACTHGSARMEAAPPCRVAQPTTHTSTHAPPLDAPPFPDLQTTPGGAGVIGVQLVSHLAQAQIFILRAPEAPTDKVQSERWELCFRGGCSQGVRLCGCAGARARHQAQLPGRGHQRAPSDSGREAEAAKQLSTSESPGTRPAIHGSCGWQTKSTRYIGKYASEEDAARAYDCAAVQAHGPGAERNFPGEVISELPLAVGKRHKQ
jgi:hypothetical protein